MRLSIVAVALGCAACSSEPAPPAADNGVLPAGPVTNVSAVDEAAIPPAIRALAEATVPGMVVAEAERKERDGRVYYDVEGKRADGSEVEIDVLEEAGGKLTAVEIQRDIPWAEVPKPAADAAKPPFVPARVIESRQVADNSVIYELFAPGRADEPAMEVRVKDGKPEVLKERAIH